MSAVQASSSQVAPPPPMSSGKSERVSASQAAARPGEGGDAVRAGSKAPLFDLSGIDLSARHIDRKAIERWVPHRGQMALLDYVVWHSDDFKQGVALKYVRDDEFWVPGHFPAKAMMPGVLMIETGAQLATFLYNARFPEPRIAAFIRMEEATFRIPVLPGDELYLLCKEVKFTPKRFSSDCQGMVDGKIVFDVRITGMAV